jgi:hypothetical protein
MSKRFFCPSLPVSPHCAAVDDRGPPLKRIDIFADQPFDVLRSRHRSLKVIAAFAGTNQIIIPVRAAATAWKLVIDGEQEGTVSPADMSCAAAVIAVALLSKIQCLPVRHSREYIPKCLESSSKLCFIVIGEGQ